MPKVFGIIHRSAGQPPRRGERSAAERHLFRQVETEIEEEMHRGSTWHIWDFHLHTPYSVLNNQFGDPEEEATWDRYISAIEERVEEIGVAAIGITDYFSIEGYKRVLRYQQEEGRLRDLLLFPNVEFRVDTFIGRKRLNFHVLFSPELSSELIEDHFLHDLIFVHENDAFQSPDVRKLKLANLTRFGETLQQQHAPFRNRSPLEIGCMNAKVSLDEIKERLEQDRRFFGLYLLVMATEDLSEASWDGQDHATRKQIMQMSHAVFSANPNTREFCLGKLHDTEEQFIDEFKSLKPCIWGCDSHSFEQRFLEPAQGRYCWIKSRVSWEGLKQILYEPEARVRVQQREPEPSKSFFTLDAIQINRTQVNDALCIDSLNLGLNPNLVALIGGRGSGKTALLDLIAACFPEGAKLSRLDNSFYYRLYCATGRQVESAQSLPISLRFRSGDEFSKQVEGESDGVFEHADILYLTQNHMDDYIANPTKLYEHIVNLVFDQIPDRRQRYDELEKDAESLEHEIQSLNLRIEQLVQQVENNLGREEAEFTQKQGELADYQNRLREQVLQQQGSGEETSRLTDRLKELKSRRDRVIALRSRISAICRDIDQVHDKYKSEAPNINQSLVRLPDISGLQILPLELGHLDSTSQALSRNVDVLEAEQPIIEDQISEAESELGELQGIDLVVAQLRRTIDNITSEIEAIEARINELKEKEGRIRSLDSDRLDKYAALMLKVLEQRFYLQNTIDQFEVGQDDLLTGLSFSAVVDTSIHKEYVSRISEKVDGRAHSFDSVYSYLSTIIEKADRQLNSSCMSEDETDISMILPLVQDLREWSKNVRLKVSTSESDFFNALLSPFFRIGLHIEFNDRPLESLSMGERAIVLLKILLGLDDTPLLIDQPEEHLDNRYIYNELTPAFRSAKSRRQIIIATHNANLVVNTDAEQIIIAEHAEGTLSYRTGALEDPEICESIKVILEGGDRAFKKREEKYGYLF